MQNHAGVVETRPHRLNKTKSSKLLEKQTQTDRKSTRAHAGELPKSPTPFTPGFSNVHSVHATLSLEQPGLARGWGVGRHRKQPHPKERGRGSATGTPHTAYKSVSTAFNSPLSPAPMLSWQAGACGSKVRDRQARPGLSMQKRWPCACIKHATWTLHLSSDAGKARGALAHMKVHVGRTRVDITAITFGVIVTEHDPAADWLHDIGRSKPLGRVCMSKVRQRCSAQAGVFVWGVWHNATSARQVRRFRRTRCTPQQVQGASVAYGAR